MEHHRLVSGLPESLAPLPCSPAPPCTLCVEGRQRTAPHSSSLFPTTAPFHTLHLDFLWPQAVRYAAHQLNLRRNDARPRVMPVSIWTVVPSRPKPSGVSHVTLQSSPPQGPVLVVSGGAGGAVAEGEGTRAAGAGGVGPGGAGGVGVEVTLVEDTAASTRRPRPVSFLGFPYVPQFPPRSSLRPVGAEPGGVPARGIGGLGGVGGGGAGSGGAGAGGTGTVAPTSCTVRFLTREQRLLRLEREECERFERAQQQQQQHQQQEHFTAGAVAAAAGESRGGIKSAAARAVAVAAVESRGAVMAAPGEGRAGVPPGAAGALTDIAREGKRVRAIVGEGRGGATQQQEVKVPSQQTPEEAGQQRLRLHDLPDPAPTRLVRGPLPSPRVPPIQSLSSSQWTRRSPLSRVVSPEPCWSHYRADGLLHLVLRSCTPPPLVLPQPLESSLSIFHDPLSDYLRASRPIVSRVLSALVTHATAPPSFVSVLVPHLYALLLVPEGDPDALVTPIPRTHAKAVLGPGFRNG
ncbi:unnamed protein product [Closterium sp. NIES-53]